MIIPPASPLDSDTLTLDAVISPDNADSAPSSHDLAATFGGDVLTLPAILLPPSGTPPAGEWLNFGEVAMPSQPGQAATVGHVRDSGRPADDDQTRGPSPETRFHHPRGMTPAPNPGPDPAEAGAGQWRRIRGAEAATKRWLGKTSPR